MVMVIVPSSISFWGGLYSSCKGSAATVCKHSAAFIMHGHNGCVQLPGASASDGFQSPGEHALDPEQTSRCGTTTVSPDSCAAHTTAQDIFSIKPVQGKRPNGKVSVNQDRVTKLGLPC